MNELTIALLTISVICIIIAIILGYLGKIEFKTQAKFFIGFFYLIYWVIYKSLLFIYNNLYYIIVIGLFVLFFVTISTYIPIISNITNAIKKLLIFIITPILNLVLAIGSIFTNIVQFPFVIYENFKVFFDALKIIIIKTISFINFVSGFLFYEFSATDDDLL
jgi:hypothetical protein